MQIEGEDQLGSLLCWVRLGHHMVLRKPSLAEAAVVYRGGRGTRGQPKTDHHYCEGNAGYNIYPQ